MVFNFTENFQFSTRLKLKGANIEFVDQMKILGTIINTRLSWDENCAAIISKFNARIQLIKPRCEHLINSCPQKIYISDKMTEEL